MVLEDASFTNRKFIVLTSDFLVEAIMTNDRMQQYMSMGIRNQCRMEDKVNIDEVK